MLRPLICALRPMQTDATSHNIVACCWGVLVNNAASVCMGLKSLTGFKLYSTTVNKCQHCCGSMQTSATCWTQQCWVLLANNVASVCTALTEDSLTTLLSTATSMYSASHVLANSYAKLKMPC